MKYFKSLSQLLVTGNGFINSLKKNENPQPSNKHYLINQRYQNKQTFFPCSKTFFILINLLTTELKS